MYCDTFVSWGKYCDYIVAALALTWTKGIHISNPRDNTIQTCIFNSQHLLLSSVKVNALCFVTDISIQLFTTLAKIKMLTSHIYIIKNYPADHEISYLGNPPKLQESNSNCWQYTWKYWNQHFFIHLFQWKTNKLSSQLLLLYCTRGDKRNVDF